MIKPENKYDFSPLGIWRMFAFIRFLYIQLLEYQEDNHNLRTRLDDLHKQMAVPILLTPDIKETNNRAVEPISSADERDDKFFNRREGESIEDFLKRISYNKPQESKVVRSANDIIEEARRKHIADNTVEEEAQDQVREESKKNVIVSDSAVNRVGSGIRAAKEGK